MPRAAGGSRSNRRPFRGPTPANVYQTLEVGAAEATHTHRQARRFPQRKYAVADVDYSLRKSSQIIENRLSKLERMGVAVHGGDIRSTLSKMIRSGTKTRHVSWVMPAPSPRRKIRTDFGDVIFQVVSTLPKVLVPNGKLYVTTESQERVQDFRFAARENGLSFREKNDMPARQAKNYSLETRIQSTSRPHKPIYRIEITYNLGKAYSKKSERKAWPRNSSENA